jgi:hypothetical protein
LAGDFHSLNKPGGAGIFPGRAHSGPSRLGIDRINPDIAKFR